MNPLTFVTHPSVRIKGTENNYTPTLCEEPACINKAPHMHCPFCVKAESYTDPVILKAHYRVKHVDKGIEFAGLKVLRCCDHCDIVGVIKGEKKFKGAHWHCYKCKNGFNRRDEAVKHYKTHFRNPQTTFQIQIAQEVNQNANCTATTTQHMTGEQDIIHPALTQAACLATTDSGLLSSNGICKNADGTVQVSIAANETINTADGQTIMIISEEQLESAQIENTFGTQIISAEDVSFLDPKQSLERKYESAEIRCQRLEEEKNQLRAELEQCKAELESQVEEINLYKRREQELLNQLNLTEQINVNDLMTSLQQQHKDLLSAQLNSLRHAFLTRAPHELLVGSNIEGFELQVKEEGKDDVVHYVQAKCEDIKENGGVGAVTSSDLLPPGMVMCVEDSEVATVTNSENINEHTLVIADMDSEAAVIASSEETLVQNSSNIVSTSPPEMDAQVELVCEPDKKRHKPS